MKKRVYFILFLICCPFADVLASSVTGVRLGFGIDMFPIGRGMENDAVRDINTDIHDTAAFSPNYGLQYQYNLTQEDSISGTAVIYSGVENRRVSNPKYDYYSGTQKINYNYAELDLVYSRKILPWFIPFGGLKAIAGASSSELPVNSDNYPDGLPEGIPYSFDFMMIGGGPGAGIKTISPLFGNFFFQTNLSTGIIFSYCSYDYTNGADDIKKNTNLYMINAAWGLLYYSQPIRTSFSLGVTLRTYRDFENGGFDLFKDGPFAENEILNLGIVFSANHIIM